MNLDAIKAKLERFSLDGDAQQAFTVGEARELHTELCRLRNGIREAASSLHPGRGQQVTPLVVNAVRKHLESIL